MRLNATSLTSCVDKPEKIRVPVSFVPQITNKLKSVFNECNMSLVYKNNNKLSDLLGSTKDKRDSLDKSGIYRMKCSDCDAEYIGQTRRALKHRCKEHIKCVQQKQVRKSAFANHAVFNQHLNVSLDNIQLVKCVSDEKRLDAYECVYIKKSKNKVNLDNGNIDSVLFTLV